MTFLNDTNVAVTAPNGATTNFALPEAAVMLFNNPLSVYFENQQNGAGNAGQAATYSRMQVKGVASSPEIYETFAGPDLNPGPQNPWWRIVGDMPSCVFILRPGHKYRGELDYTGFWIQPAGESQPGARKLIRDSARKK